MSADGPIVIRSVGRNGLLVMIGVQAAIAAALLLLGLPRFPVLAFPLLAILGVAVRARTTVTLDDAGIAVNRRDGQCYAWSDLLAVTWQRGGPFGGGGPVVRPQGGPYDTPGPNAPVMIASLTLSRRAERNAQAALQERAKAHGVAWSDELLKMLYPSSAHVLPP